MSEVDELRRQLAWANGQLMARDRADAEARVKAMDDEQKKQDETANAERQKAVAAEKERIRRGAWVNALLKTVVETNPGAPFDVDKFEQAIPAKGWPPGTAESDFHWAGESILGHEADDAASTMLGKMLSELTQRGERLRAAK